MPLFGLLNVDKPPGMTSRRAVDRIARLAKPAKVGHAGTLDPLASGVLVLGIGPATRLIEYVQEAPKQYRATFLLGRSSPTEDVDGEVTELPSAVPPTREQLEQAARGLTGSIEQRPPAFSALKVGGRRAYDLARAGRSVQLEPRQVRIDRLRIEGYEYPELCLDVQCSGGTYIRSLGRDLAERCGTAAVMSALVRTAVGPFTIAEAVALDTPTAENLPGLLLPPELAVRGMMPEVTVSPDEAGRLARGQTIEAREGVEDRCAAFDATGRLLAILTRTPEGVLRAAKNLSGN
ncbi:MAG: tRNA pseudouridine(55) synthase TruB [Planctomycetota bacterium]|nr:MAG: tRNA pseudouridine(55) synthase TruB [Planctomycetota bacterium]